MGNVLLALEAATALCTMAGAWFAMRMWTGRVWLMLVVAASCGIAAVVIVAILPLTDWLHGKSIGIPFVLELALVAAVFFGAYRMWLDSLDQVDFI